MVKKAGGIEVFGFEVALKTKESIWVFPQANLSYTRGQNYVTDSGRYRLQHQPLDVE